MCALGGVCSQHLTAPHCSLQDSDILQKFPVFGSYSKGDFTSSVSFKHAAQLSEEQKATIWEIFEANMKGIYTKDSQKWNPKEKRREMLDVSTPPMLLCLTPCTLLPARSRPHWCSGDLQIQSRAC